MEELVSGQRWISETEPEMGLGTLLDADNRFLEIFFNAHKTKRRYSISNAPLKRVIFKIGDKIEDKKGNSILIDKIIEKNGLIFYYQKNIEISETDLSDKISFTSPEERLFSGNIDENYLFDLRYETLLLQNKIKSYELNGLLGSRISLLPHQFYLANEVTKRPYVRLLLADEVGLGKTIEASLIIHKLLFSEQIERVIIITPEPLVNQWFVELIRKFNLTFSILDEDVCEDMEKFENDINPFEEKQLILCSLPFLKNSKKRQTQAILSNWDLVVVDEAHHLLWTPENSSAEYKIVEQLAIKSPHLLLLTATPEQLGIMSHFARLRLLDPERFFDLDTFIREVAEYSQIGEVITNLINKNKISDREQEILLKSYGNNKKIQKQLSEVLKGNELERVNLIESMVDQHGTGRVLFRNTRSSMKNLPQRIVKKYPLEHNNRFINLDTQNISELLKYDPKIDWLVSLLKELKNEKILLICNSKNMIIAIDKLLKTKINIKTALFHEDLSLLARDRNAAYFSQKDGANILLCSEIGSEGRNFQFSHHLVLYDLPLNTDLLEQRIGRLDRIGQKHDINIHVPYVKNTAQEILFELYQQGLNAFKSFPKGGIKIFEKFQEKINQAIANPLDFLEKNNEQFIVLLEDIQDYKNDLYLKLERGRDRLLEYNSFRPEIGNKIIEEIKKIENDKTLENFMNNIFEHFGVEYEELENDNYFVSPSDLMFIENFPFLPLDGITITYNRDCALEREEFTFLTLEHPMVNGIIDILLSSEQGNTAITLFESAEDSMIVLEAIYIIESIAPKELHISRFLPPTPIKVLINENLEESEINFEEFKNELSNLSPDQVFIKPEITKLIKIMLEKNKELADIKAKEIVEEKVLNMNKLLNYEENRLIELKKVNPNITQKEIDFIKNKKNILNKNLNSYRLRLDSLRLICSEPDEW
ncbi:MAG: RNA polymerase-associated protein RapA [Cyanobacteriota bacterium]